MPCEPDRDRHPAPRGATRRQFLTRGAVAAGALALGSLDLSEVAGGQDATSPSAPRPAGRRHDARPNILVIIVDEWRAPRWFPAADALDALLPHTAGLRREAVSFERHFTVSNNCTPSRGALVTGLYSHQTGCLVTGRSELEPGFPTWGTLLREHGYLTSWWGKWHLSRSRTLEPWGFSGGTFPSPNGGPGQGLRVDPQIASQFEDWLDAGSGDGPWCTTVSFVNPHDVVWWWRLTEPHEGERSAPRILTGLPGNYETPAQLRSRGKPRLQLSLQDVAAAGFGAVPFTGPRSVTRWGELRNLYLRLQRDVDVQIGRVLLALARRPAVERNTIVIFTSDHGEYAGSHGLRGKGAAVYDEGIQVPLYVKDPRGVLTRAHNVSRHQLTSSVDVTPLLLTIATGSGDWRAEQRYSHLAGRADLAAICADPAAPGRPWIAHATDEVATEFCPEPYAASAPRHVMSVRTHAAKYAIYSNWRPGTIDIAPGDEDGELYEYSTHAGRMELDNRRGASRLEESMHRLLVERALPHELRAPLPSHLARARARGLRNFLAVSDSVDAQISRELRRRLAERRARARRQPVPDWRLDPFAAEPPLRGSAGPL